MCSRNGGVESRAKGGHERPGFSREVPARKSGWPPTEQRKEDGVYPTGPGELAR